MSRKCDHGSHTTAFCPECGACLLLTTDNEKVNGLLSYVRGIVQRNNTEYNGWKASSGPATKSWRGESQEEADRSHEAYMAKAARKNVEWNSRLEALEMLVRHWVETREDKDV